MLPARSRRRLLSPVACLRQNGPYADELAWALYNSDASPSTAFIDFPFDSSSGLAYDAALGRLHRFLNGVVRNRRQQSFETVLGECKHHCENLNKSQMRRLNYMLKKFPAVIRRERQAVAADTKLRVLMLVLMEHADIVEPFIAAAQNESSFTVTVSRQDTLESSLLAQFREFTTTGKISDLLAARVIGLYFLLPKLMRNGNGLSARIRFTAEAEVATLDLAAIRRMYEL